MPAKKKPAARKPAARRARRSAHHFHLPKLEQRQLDLIGLGLVGLALFFAFLVYFSWDGGRAGSEAVEGLRWLLGAAHYLVPVALAAAGAILMLRPVLPAVRPFRAGAICLFGAVTLGLSAGTLGVGPGGTRPEWWDPVWVKTRGGMVGDYLTAKGFAVVDAVEAIASSRGISITTAALAWLLSKPGITAPLASARTPQQLPDLMAAADVELTADEVSALDQASQSFA